MWRQNETLKQPRMVQEVELDELCGARGKAGWISTGDGVDEDR